MSAPCAPERCWAPSSRTNGRGGDDLTWTSSANWTLTCPPGQTCSTGYPDDANDDAFIEYTDGTQTVKVPSYTIRLFKVINDSNVNGNSNSMDVTLQSNDNVNGNVLDAGRGVILDARNEGLTVRVDQLLEINTNS